MSHQIPHSEMPRAREPQDGLSEEQREGVAFTAQVYAEGFLRTWYLENGAKPIRAGSIPDKVIDGWAESLAEGFVVNPETAPSEAEYLVFLEAFRNRCLQGYPVVVN